MPRGGKYLTMKVTRLTAIVVLLIVASQLLARVVRIYIKHTR